MDTEKTFLSKKVVKSLGCQNTPNIQKIILSYFIIIATVKIFWEIFETFFCH